MPGPKYVKDFEFPSNFGFTGSAGQTRCRPHSRQAPRRFAEGGPVKAPDPKAPKAPMPPPQPEKKLSLADLMKGKGRRQQEQDLGLKRGGKVKRAMGGPVKAAKGGECKAAVDKGIAKHIRAPKPRGHGVK